MKTVAVKGIVLGEGIPKICVPIVAKTVEEAIAQANAILPLTVGEEPVVDLVEWRADWLKGVENWENCLAAAKGIREVLTDIPLLFTIRTKAEGGEQELSKESYLKLTELAACSGLFDLVDVELSAGEESVRRILDAAHENKVSVICSNHDFHGTPAKEEILSRLQQMERYGADVLKIAVMPNSPADVLTLLGATEEMHRQTTRPLITMSMSAMGVISRLSGEAFGSCLTFGAVGNASAPGQIGAKELRAILKSVHGNR